jgi:spermidine/putrescine transport system permease protein
MSSSGILSSQDLNSKKKPAIRTKPRPRTLLLGIPVIVWLILIVILPVFLMLLMSFKLKSGYDITNVFTIQNYLAFFRESTYWRMLIKSFRMAFIVSVTAIVVSYPLAFFISRILKKGRQFLFMLIIIPLWVSYLVRIIAWRTILGNNGLLNNLLMNLHITREPLSIFLYNNFSVVLTLTYIAIPFVFIPLYTALEKIPGNLVEAARDLGANDFHVFKSVILPLSSPGLITGFMLSFIIALGDYIIPQQLGGKAGLMFGNIVWSQFGFASNWPLGSALGFILFTIAAVILALTQRFGGEEGIYM